MKSATISNEPAIINFTGNTIGYDAVFNLDFTDDAGAALDISADDFSLTILETDGTTFDIYGIGTGLTIDGTDTLVISIDSLVTDTMSGSYRYFLDWTPDGGTLQRLLEGCISFR
jgi:hypothetical protein